MTKIRIIGGRYGYISPSGVYSVKTVDDSPFEVEDSEAKRLVKRKVAEIVGEHENSAENEPLPNTEGSNPTNGENGADNDMPPEYSTKLSVNELRAIAKKVGISFKVGTTKEEMVAALDEYFGISDDKGESDDDSDFELSAEDPVV